MTNSIHTVYIRHNYYDGKHYNHGGKAFPVLAKSPDEAEFIAKTHKDKIESHLRSLKVSSGSAKRNLISKNDNYHLKDDDIHADRFKPTGIFPNNHHSVIDRDGNFPNKKIMTKTSNSKILSPKNESTIDLIQSISSGDTILSSQLFNELLMSRISDLIDTRRIEVAQDMFTESQSVVHRYLKGLTSDEHAAVQKHIQTGGHFGEMYGNKNKTLDSAHGKIMSNAYSHSDVHQLPAVRKHGLDDAHEDVENHIHDELEDHFGSKNESVELDEAADLNDKPHTLYVMHNFKDGANYNYGGRKYRIMAKSPEEALSIAKTHKDKIEDHLRNQREISSKKLIIRKSDNLHLKDDSFHSPREDKALISTTKILNRHGIFQAYNRPKEQE